MRDAALQFVLKLLDNLVTDALHKDRDVEVAKAKARNLKRFGSQGS